MTISELIEQLKKLDQNMPVCGQTETTVWYLEPKDLIVSEHVWAFEGNEQKEYPLALMFGWP
jgi:hypothetical protein